MDASKAGVGGVLNVLREGVMLPVGFYSIQFRGAEHNYSATELDGLAIYCTVIHFAHYLYGCVFTVITDHKLLEGRGVGIGGGTAPPTFVKGWPGPPNIYQELQ